MRSSARCEGMWRRKRTFWVEVSCKLVEVLGPAPVLWLAILGLCRAIPAARPCIRRMQACQLRYLA